MADKESSGDHEKNVEWFKEVVYVSRGRINGLFFFILFMISQTPIFLGLHVSKNTELPGTYMLSFMAVIFLLWFYGVLNALAKRLRDMGLGGWFTALYMCVLCIIVAVDGLWGLDGIGKHVVIMALIVVTLWPQKKTDNKYADYLRNFSLVLPANKTGT